MNSIKRLVEHLLTEAESRTTLDFLHELVRVFGRNLLQVSSMGAEDQVLTHLLSAIDPSIRIVTLDTGRLPQQTYDVIEQTHERYGIRIQLLHPDAEQLQRFTRQHGPNAFYRSVELRKECCRIRKVLPLAPVLNDCSAWISGIRRGQSLARSNAQVVEIDEEHDCIKLNPLAWWSEDEIWSFIHEHGIPYNTLHDHGYPSIGCAPCTRAVQPGEDPRAGRWWWEQNEDNRKECGLHVRRRDVRKTD